MAETVVEEDADEAQKPDTEPTRGPTKWLAKKPPLLARKDPTIKRATVATKDPAKKSAWFEANQKLFAAHECYAMTATTAVTVQDTSKDPAKKPPRLARKDPEIKRATASRKDSEIKRATAARKDSATKRATAARKDSATKRATVATKHPAKKPPKEITSFWQ